MILATIIIRVHSLTNLALSLKVRLSQAEVSLSSTSVSSSIISIEIYESLILTLGFEVCLQNFIFESFIFYDLYFKFQFGIFGFLSSLNFITINNLRIDQKYLYKNMRLIILKSMTSQ